ncbi:MAG: hypothetical protein HY796_00710 [Elusimicrobia bacterium]|nr:hypothetical protein [Elusimicrobiota bacterium]
MFDGTAKLKAVDFNVVSSKNAAITGKTASLGKGGNVTDLKSSEPAAPKFSQVTEFSLASTKTASAAAVKASPESCYPEAYIAKCTCLPPNDSIVLGYDMCYGACAEKILTLGNCPVGGIGFGAWFEENVKKPWNIAVRTVKDQITSVLNWLGGNVENIKDWISDNHELKGDKPCGTTWYNPDKECCSGGAAFPEQGCTTGSIEISGPSPELILYKPASDSKPASLRITAKCCPGSIQWTKSSDKIKFTGPTNQAVVYITPVSESEKPGDVSVTVTIAGGATATRKITVRRPKYLSHPDLNSLYQVIPVTGGFNVGTKTTFPWTLTDQLPTAQFPLGQPLAGLEVAEQVTLDYKKSQLTSDQVTWDIGAVITGNKTTNAAGQVADQYGLHVNPPTPLFKVYVYQVLQSAGYKGTTEIVLSHQPQEITTTPGIPTNPVELR